MQLLQAPSFLLIINPRTRPSCSRPVHMSLSFCLQAGLGFQRASPAHGRACKWVRRRRMPQLRLHDHEVRGGRVRNIVPQATGAPAGESINGNGNGYTIDRVQYELPAINCHFSVKCHPEYESVRDECDAWTLSLFDPPLRSDDPQHALYLKGHYCLFTSLIFPSTPSRRRLALLTKFTNWSFVLDDMLEHADMQTATELLNGLDSVLASSFDKNPTCNVNGMPLLRPRCSARVSAFLERLRREVWDEMCSDMTPSFKLKVAAAVLRCANAMREHVRMTMQQELDSTSKPTFDHLMEVRLYDSYAKPYLSELMAYLLEIDVEDILKSQHDEIADLHAKVEELKLAAVKHSTWANDLFSVRKELFNGDRLSVIVLLLAKRGIHSIGDCKGSADVNVQEVINEVWGMIKEQERIAARLLQDIRHAPGSNLRGHNELVMYSEEMCRCMAGNMYWSTLTARYNGLHPLPWNTNTPTPLSIHSHLQTSQDTLDFLHPSEASSFTFK